MVFCLYSIGLLCYYLLQPFGKWVLFSVLTFWFIVQFFCHWFYTIFGATRKKIQGYNDCFRDTIRLFPMSEKRLIPDLYHIVLHILILINLILCL
ncbi:MAG: hypothetical protein IJ973_05845 [Christensenellaceae bacterium]|nr:hypothetical protein [Christensenellaceae bacterium]